MSEDPPKQELLLKLLKMTTSDNDSEALVAIRKANELLISASWDWDKLIHAKIRVIGDPFGGPANIPVPTTNGSRFSAPTPPPKPRYQPQYNPTASQQSPQQSTPPRPPQPPPPPPKPRIDSTSPNRYAGFCYCCGAQVDQRAGWIFDPSKLNSMAASKWVIACDSCNTSAYARVGHKAATRHKPVSPSLGDI